ncbi:uncharacterized protein LOC129698878 isoform X1 [Leucoraja erinacea]|uniref:uncharacterized protein LOC129698878 isoform X1 n=1 Tax=Leucoraja erinaceus TaxID=7782 RepID=UPI002453BD1E|nr:uncharacterized protein LOC129698878 isoform X1 [Leucoraja erinacea]
MHKPINRSLSLTKFLYFLGQTQIWDYRTHRIQRKHLCNSKEVGGLSLPNFIYYYWAVHIKNIMYWLDSSTQQLEWIRMEKEECYPHDIGTNLLSPIKLNSIIYKKNPIIHNIIRIWKQIKVSLKLNNLSVLTPLLNNPAFKPSLIDNTYQQWDRLGIRKVGDMYEVGKLLSFQQLKLKFKLKDNQYFKYIQVCDFMKKYTHRFQTIFLDPLEEAMNIKADSQKLISYFYNNILNRESPSTEALREDWEHELMIKISKDRWEKHLMNTHNCSINARHNLIQFKLLHRLYYSKTRLNKFYPNVSPRCDKCLFQNANITHSFVGCTKLNTFWSDIFDIFTKLFKSRIEPKTEWIIFGIIGEDTNLNKDQNVFFNYGLIIGKKLILKFWKNTTTPTVKMWIRNMMDIARLEEMRLRLIDKYDQFLRSWSLFIDFLESCDAAVP